MSKRETMKKGSAPDRVKVWKGYEDEKRRNYSQTKQKSFKSWQDIEGSNWEGKFLKNDVVRKGDKC